jgi:hypothetical protein
MGMQSRRILVFIGNCAMHPQHMSFQRNAEVAYYAPNRTNMFEYCEMCQRVLP